MVRQSTGWLFRLHDHFSEIFTHSLMVVITVYGLPLPTGKFSGILRLNGDTHVASTDGKLLGTTRYFGRVEVSEPLLGSS